MHKYKVHMRRGVRQALEDKGIEFRERGREIITHCLANNCDEDSTGIEAHMYIHADHGCFYCFKCGEKGSYYNLLKLMGANPKKYLSYNK